MNEINEENASNDRYEKIYVLAIFWVYLAPIMIIFSNQITSYLSKVLTGMFAIQFQNMTMFFGIIFIIAYVSACYSALCIYKQSKNKGYFIGLCIPTVIVFGFMAASLTTLSILGVAICFLLYGILSAIENKK